MMTTRRVGILGMSAVLLLGGAVLVNATMRDDAPAATAVSAKPAGGPLESAGVLAFGPKGVLFVGDSQGATVYAFEVRDEAKDESAEPLAIASIDQKIASLLGTTAHQITVNDLAVHPASQQLYLSVTRGKGNGALPVVLRTNRSGKLETLDLGSTPFTKVSVANVYEKGAKSKWGQDLRRMAITDLAWVDGELLIAGLSNTEFASTLRRTPYPFRDALAVNTLEIFHTSHDKYETQSPIESFLPFAIQGKPSLIAGYGCAPIASFTLADLKSKTHLRGTTLAELGGGNRPLDMIAFEKEGQRRLLIANSDRTLMSMSAEDIEKAQPMTKGVSAAYVSAGVPYLSIAQIGITQLDNLNSKFVVVVQRDIADGSLNVKSLSKAWL
jgi:hypothetical protein